MKEAVLSPSQSVMVQDWPSMCMVLMNAQITPITHNMHLNSFYLVLP